MQPHDLPRTLRRLEPSGWLGAARRFASCLRTAGHEPGRLLVVGTPQDEPWHLTAHLADAARWQAAPALTPVLVRWQVPEGAPPHLSVGLDAVHRAGRGTTVLVAAPRVAEDRLLERLDDARCGGATLLALHAGDDPLEQLVHDALLLPPAHGAAPGLDVATHVLTLDPARLTRRPSLPWRRGLRADAS